MVGPACCLPCRAVLPLSRPCSSSAFVLAMSLEAPCAPGLKADCSSRVAAILTNDKGSRGWIAFCKRVVWRRQAPGTSRRRLPIKESNGLTPRAGWSTSAWHWAGPTLSSPPAAHTPDERMDLHTGWQRPSPCLLHGQSCPPHTSSSGVPRPHLHATNNAHSCHTNNPAQPVASEPRGMGDEGTGESRARVPPSTAPAGTSPRRTVRDLHARQDACCRRRNQAPTCLLTPRSRAPPG